MIYAQYLRNHYMVQLKHKTIKFIKNTGQMATLLAVLEKYRQRLYKSTLRAKVNGYEFTRLLPPPKGSGFPPTTTERILFMNFNCQW